MILLVNYYKNERFIKGSHYIIVSPLFTQNGAF